MKKIHLRHRVALLAALGGALTALADETLVDFSDGLFPNGDGPIAYRGLRFVNDGGGSGGPGMSGTGNWGSLFGNIPGASLGLAFNDQWGDSDLRLYFPEGTTRFELLVSTGDKTVYAVEVYGPGGEFLGSKKTGMPGDNQAAVIGGMDVSWPTGVGHIRLYEPAGENFSVTVIDDIRYGDKASQCAPDLDGSGTLDLFDFLEYTNLFNAGNAGADCDGSKDLDLFDFLCFTNAFNAGC